MPEPPGATRRTLLTEAARRLAEAGVPEARRQAEWLATEALGCRRLDLLTEPEHRVGAAAQASFEVLLQRRLAGEPLQYVLGHTDFFGLRVAVSPAVLIPRPETEQLVEAALGLLAPRPAPRVLDAGTGSGCIALALKHERPDAEVAACDVSRAALAVARANAAALGLSVEFFEADLLAADFATRSPDGLDLLISNPPYVPDAEAAELSPEVRDHEPATALFAGADPLQFFRALAGHAKKLLGAGGHLVVETHAEHGEAVRQHFEAEGFSEPVLRADLAGLPRIVHACWSGGRSLQ